MVCIIVGKGKSSPRKFPSHQVDANMNSYNILNLMTGRIDKDREGNVIIIHANSERGAKSKFSKASGYRNWNLYTVVRA